MDSTFANELPAYIFLYIAFCAILHQQRSQYEIIYFRYYIGTIKSTREKYGYDDNENLEALFFAM